MVPLQMQQQKYVHHIKCIVCLLFSFVSFCFSFLKSENKMNCYTYIYLYIINTIVFRYSAFYFVLLYAFHFFFSTVHYLLDAFHLLLSACCFLLAAFRLPLSACCLLLSTCRFPLAAFCLSLSNCRFLLVTFFPLVAFHLLLSTCRFLST